MCVEVDNGFAHKLVVGDGVHARLVEKGRQLALARHDAVCLPDLIFRSGERLASSIQGSVHVACTLAAAASQPSSAEFMNLEFDPHPER